MCSSDLAQAKYDSAKLDYDREHAAAIGPKRPQFRGDKDNDISPAEQKVLDQLKAVAEQMKVAADALKLQKDVMKRDKLVNRQPGG